MPNCRDCGQPTNKAAQSKRCENCRLVKERARRRQWNKDHPEVCRQATRTYKLKNPEYAKHANFAGYKKNWHRVKRYGITTEDWEDLFAAQNYKCAICKKITPSAKGWNTDHCHKTNKVRGVLCAPCNVLLGLANDDTIVLKSAIKYLNKHTKEINNGAI